MSSWLLGPDDEGVTVRVVNGRIAEVRRFGSQLAESDSGGGRRGDAVAVTIDCRGARIVPGDVNAHTHLYSGLVPFGMPPPEPPPENFVQILERVWWPLDRALDESILRAAAEWYLAEALLAGTTSLIDHHESPNFIDGSLSVLSEAAEKLGVRLVVTYGATERNGGRAEAKAGLAECARFLAGNRSDRVRGLIGLHASFTVSDETIREAGDLGRAVGVGLHVHVAEDLADVEDAHSRGYAGPWDRLRRLRASLPGSVYAHCVHASVDEVRGIAAEGGWIVQNPRSNAGNRVGYPANIELCARVALGTDGYPSVMAEERGALLKTDLAGDAVSAITSGGTASAGAPVSKAAAGVDVEARIRQSRALMAHFFANSFEIEPGATADLVVRGAGGVRHVMVAGELVVRDSTLVTADLGSLRTRAQTQAQRLWSRR